MCRDARRWPLTNQVWRQFDQFDLVMERTRVDAVLAARKEAGAGLAQARNICRVCLHQTWCRSLLEGDEADSIMAFCPNAGFLAQCRRRGLCEPRKTRRGR